MQKIYSGILLALMVFGLFGLACAGLYLLLVKAFGDTFVFIPVIGVVGLIALTVGQWSIHKSLFK